MSAYFFFYFIKISFPVHFLFKWRQNLSARPRMYTYVCIYIYTYIHIYIYSPHGATTPQWAEVSSLSTLHDHTQIHHTQYDSSGRVISPTQRPLPDNTQHSQQTSKPPAEFEPAISSPRERPQTDARDPAATALAMICSRNAK